MFTYYKHDINFSKKKKLRWKMRTFWMITQNENLHFYRYNNELQIVFFLFFSNMKHYIFGVTVIFMINLRQNLQTFSMVLKIVWNFFFSIGFAFLIFVCLLKCFFLFKDDILWCNNHIMLSVLLSEKEAKFV